MGHEVMGHEVIGLDNFSDYYCVHLKGENAEELRSLEISLVEQDLCRDSLCDILPLGFDVVSLGCASRNSQ